MRRSRSLLLLPFLALLLPGPSIRAEVAARASMRGEEIAAELASIRAEIRSQGAGWTASSTGFLELGETSRQLRLQERPWPAPQPRRKSGGKPLGYDRSRGGIDWRFERGGFVTGVRDQGDCASGWAHAATACLESAFLRAIDAADLPDFDLSEEYLLSCMGDYGLSGNCERGWPEDALWLSRDIGIREQSLGTAGDRECSGFDGAPAGRRFHSADYGTVCESFDLEAIKDALHNLGPLVTTMTVHQGFAAYAGGVYRPAGEVIGYHAVLIVGYDERGGYFIAKNSWGERWGMGGYFFIAFDSGCGFGDWTSFARFDGQGRGPFAAMEPGAMSARTGAPVTFSDHSVETDSRIVAWEWDFDGDGHVDAMGPGPHSYIYRKAGRMQPRLRVLDAERREDVFSLPEPIEIVFAGPVWAVDGERGSVYGDGSPENPFLYIQMGIDASADGDTVMVLPGVYRGPQNTELRPGGRSILLLGRGEQGEVVLDGEGERRLIILKTGESGAFSAQNLVFSFGQDPFRGGGVLIEDGAASFRDCRFNDCAVGPESSAAGAAVWSNSLVRFENCYFGGNISGGTGGALHATGGLLDLRLSVFEGNGARNGGAVSARACSLSVVHCLFEANQADVSGGALLLGGGAVASIDGTLFRDNRVDFEQDAETELPGGGALYLATGAGLRMTSSILARNSAPLGGGLFVDGARAALGHLTIWENSAAEAGGAIYQANGEVALSNSLLWQNRAPLSPEISEPGFTVMSTENCLIAGGHTGAAIFDADPRMIDPEGGDFSLAAGSPCLGAGRADETIALDYEGFPRSQPYGSPPDIGACESPLAGETAVPDQETPAMRFVGIYPNPFNPSTTLTFDLPESAEVKLSIYMPTGRMVALLLDEPLSAGTHQVPWTAVDEFGEGLASGLFLARLEVTYGDGRHEQEIHKAMLVK